MHTANTERIITQILRQPERFYMGSWIDTAFIDTNEGDGVPDVCGTSCCIAGWAVYNDRLPSEADPHDAGLTIADLYYNVETIDWAEEGADLLGLEADDGRIPLFFVTDWPGAYRLIYDDQGEHIAAASLLRDMLDGTVQLSEADRRSWWRQFAAKVPA
jgi:hypothetical protein